MKDDAELARAKAALTEASAQMQADRRSALPTTTEGEPQVEIVRAGSLATAPR